MQSNHFLYLTQCAPYANSFPTEVSDVLVEKRSRFAKPENQKRKNPYLTRNRIWAFRVASLGNIRGSSKNLFCPTCSPGEISGYWIFCDAVNGHVITDISNSICESITNISNSICESHGPGPKRGRPPQQRARARKGPKSHQGNPQGPIGEIDK